jgi:NAD+-dependent protein deacetylase SIR2
MNLKKSEWTSLTTTFHKSKRIVVITGAGISVSGGIPDFRSADGLYNLVKTQYPTTVFKGQELFDASCFSDPAKTKLFYSFMSYLKQTCQQAQVTDTHLFLKYLSDEKKLMRVYTQNVDDLDHRCGLSVGYTVNDNVVPMHGSLDRVKCTICAYSSDFDDSLVTLFQSGCTKACPRCTTMNQTRIDQGKRKIAIGLLRPDIVLYNEHHCRGDDIALLQNKDIKKADVIMVMGTSLKIVGVKRMIKSFAESVRDRGGVVVFVNRTEVGKEWDDIFDFQVLGDADMAVERIREEMNALKKVQEQKALSREKKKEKKEREEKSTVPITKFFKTIKVEIADENVKSQKAKGKGTDRKEKNYKAAGIISS